MTGTEYAMKVRRKFDETTNYKLHKMKKITLTILSLLLVGISASSQTASSVLSMSRTNTLQLQESAAGPAGFNPWLGAQLLLNIDGTRDISDNLIVSGRLLYQIKTTSKKFKIPIMGNISDLTSDLENKKEDEIKQSVNEISMSDKGLNIGLYPYYILVPYDRDFYLLVHGSGNWKLNRFKLTDSTSNNLNILRFTAGFEMGYGILDNITGDKPITLSITPSLSIFNKVKYNDIFGSNKSMIWGLELTGIIPISKTGIAVVLDGIISKGTDAAFRAGIIFSGKPDQE